MKKWLTLLQDALAAIVLGIALTFAFAPYEIFPMAILAMLGLLALWIKNAASPKRAFWLGYLFGLGLFGVGVSWVFISIHVVAGVPTFLAGTVTVGMIAFLALYPALVGYLIIHFFPINNTAKIVGAFPAIWVFSEWVRGILFSGFPWLFVGYSQTNSPLKGYAPIFSVYGVSFAVTLSAAVILNAIFKFKHKAYFSAYKNLLTLVIIWIAGGLLSLIPWTEPHGEPISVALVQGNVAQTIKWSSEHLQLSFDRYTELTKPLWGKYKLIIWPEAAIPVPLQNVQEFINELDAKAISSGSTLMLGIPIGATGFPEHYYNAIVSLGTNKKVYLKRHLVPFGEYTPFSDYLSNTLGFMNIPMSTMLPGNSSQAPLAVDDTKIFPSICYEIAFPELSRTRDSTIGILLTVTNDAWFGESNAQAQHLQMAQMRAQEMGRPLLFVSNDGITAIVGPDGRVISALPPREISVLTGMVQPMRGTTPWMYNGSDPILFIIICLVIVAIRFSKNKRGSLEQTTSTQNK